MLDREQVLNLVWIAVGGAVCLHAASLGLWDGKGPDSGFLPLACGLALALAGLAQLLTRPSVITAEAPFFPDRGAAIRVCGVLLGLVLTTLLMPRLGFLITAVAVMIFLLQIIERQRWWVVLVVACTSSLAVWWLFDRMLDVVLPRGPWGI